MSRKLALFAVTIALLGAMAAACAQSPIVVYMVVTATPEGFSVAPEATAETVAPEATEETTPAPHESAPEITVRQIYVAEQPFQRGSMFWLEPIGQIWVIVETEPGFGYWQVYEDAFREGDPEFDPTITPPAGLIQPIRGFGLVWRNGENVRQELGWANDIEVGFVANYEYHPGAGSTAEQPVPGYHFMQNQYGIWYRFNEINGTWQIVEHTPTPPSLGS